MLARAARWEKEVGDPWASTVRKQEQGDDGPQFGADSKLMHCRSPLCRKQLIFEGHFLKELADRRRVRFPGISR